MVVLLATTNQGKVAELKRLFEGSGIELTALQPDNSTEEIETGSSFEQNAILKAEYYFQQTGLPTIADDSGLEVDALKGAPGILSARFGGPGLDDQGRLTHLLCEINDVPQGSRSARFVCAAALVWSGGTKVFVREARGEITAEPRGESGFGYDPIFFYPPMDCTFGEIDPAAKLLVSHRGLAFAALREWMLASGLLDTPKSNDKMAFLS